MATCVFEKNSKESVVNKLSELFGNVINLDIIKTVANSCQYDVTKSSNRLLEITSCSMQNTMDTGANNAPISLIKDKNSVVQNSHNFPLNCSASVANLQTKKSKKSAQFDKAVNYVLKGYKVLIIMRGVPGSGKSFLAKNILEQTIGYGNTAQDYILSADNFFYKNGRYEYDSSKIQDAHGWNHNRAFQAMSKGFSPIIIDNTNIQMWQMKPYAMMATDFGYIIEILEPDTHWCFNDKELTKRNTHGVPKVTIRDMLDQYEKNVTPQKLLTAYNLDYRLQRPPQYRLHPPLNKTSTSINSMIANFSQASNLNRQDLMKSKSVSYLNHNFNSNTEPIETINLMDFTEDDLNIDKPSTNSIKLSDNSVSTTWGQNLVDNILTCPLQNEQNVIVIDSPIKGPTVEKKNELFQDIESAWGIDEKALRSWELVTPIDDLNSHTNDFQQTINRSNKVQTADSSSNTEEEYFLFKRNSLGNNLEKVKVLRTANRDINRCTPNKEPVIMKKLMLHKSCLTDDIFEDYEVHMSQLRSLFPGVPKTHLSYWYNKSKGDLDWTIDFLLENNEEIMEDSLSMEDEPEQSHVKVKSTRNSSESSTENEPQKETKSKRNQAMDTSESRDLKRFVESKFDINDEHYSKHLLKVKQYKFKQPCDTSTDVNVLKCKPSTSKERIMTNAGEVILIDSDIEFDECDIEDNNENAEQKSEETLELNLGDNFASQLEARFGDPSVVYPKGFQPVVQLPVGLARQLYTFYIESVYQQMENQQIILDRLNKEDEEFARKLQAEEVKNLLTPSQTVSSTPNFQEIMEEQAAQNVYKEEADKWKTLNPDNLAARLTRQKLFTTFPTIDQNTLVELLYAHKNNYKETVEALIASIGPEDVKGHPDAIREPPIRDEVVKEMKEAQNCSQIEEHEEQHEATYYREEASKFLRKREELYQKAQLYHQKGMTEVAQFYSGLASQQTIFYDRANNMAATTFLDEHSKRLEDFNTLDLHYLYVKEAMPALDVFLDRNINLLKHSASKQSEYLQIITGRGKRSENGKPKIKPAVMTRLKKRKINFAQLNPGLLKIKITKNSLVTSDMASE